MKTSDGSAVISSLSESALGCSVPIHTAQRATARAEQIDADHPPLRVAYIMSRFPKLTETFILFEIKALEELGVAVEIYPLWREHTRVMHEDAKAYVARAHFRRLLSWQVLQANLRYLLKSPRGYLAALFLGLRANWGSARYLLGFIVAFPKAVLFAYEMEQGNIGHVHAHFASHPAAVALVIQRLTGIPYSFTAHGSDLHRDVHMLREKVDEAAFVVAISVFNRDKIVSECGAANGGKVRVIHCGTDLRVFRPRSETATDCREDVLRIACIGTLHEVKGQHFLIEACRLLRERGLSFRLQLVGNGPDAAQLQANADRCGVRDWVVFRGSLTRPEVARLLKETHVVAAPSVPTKDGRREGIPVALMEAMSSGLPVVASRLTGIPELVSDRANGRLVPPGDPVALADALEELARIPELRDEWGRAARKSVENQFDVQRNALELLREIRRVVRNNGERCSFPIERETAE